jgi:hypothetical protein
MKQTRLALFSAAIVFSASFTMTSCKKSTPITEIDFNNNAFTAVSITVNGQSATIAPGGYKAFTGASGGAVSGSASTANYSASGTQIGKTVNWTISDNFPPSSESPQQDYIDVPSTYFFLEIDNQSAYNIGSVYVNYGLSDQSQDDLVLTPGATYYIGYYDANANSTLYLTSTLGGISWGPSIITLPFTQNQYYIYNAN